MAEEPKVRTPQQMIEDDTPPTYHEWKQLIMMFILVDRNLDRLNQLLPGFNHYLRGDGPNRQIARKHDNRYKRHYGPYGRP